MILKTYIFQKYFRQMLNELFNTLMISICIGLKYLQYVRAHCVTGPKLTIDVIGIPKRPPVIFQSDFEYVRPITR